MAIDKNTVEGSLLEMKGKIRQMWGKLTDDDVAETKGNWELLAGKLQRTYGYTKEQAALEVEKFRTESYKNSLS